jgi:hypothetical protein
LPPFRRKKPNEIDVKNRCGPFLIAVVSSAYAQDLGYDGPNYIGPNNPRYQQLPGNSGQSYGFQDQNGNSTGSMRGDGAGGWY